jgi:hypothetical protein
MICAGATTAENSERTAHGWLLFGPGAGQRPWISAANKISMADNSLQKQQKQRVGFRLGS